MDALLERFFSGDVRALARVITCVENRSSGSLEILRELFRRTGGAQVIGITGSPGAGKSSLVDRMAISYRHRKNATPLGIIAVDPSSPFTGGAILGDRIRMQTLEIDSGIFIRSMATRGQLGGLAAATADVVSVMDAAGRNPVIVETVGVGQDEIEIVKLADISIVVLVPGMGDDIQALKAGIMEIGDVFVINKCDRPGADKMVNAVTAMLSLAHRHDGWIPTIVRTTATKGEGIDDLITEIDRCIAYFQTAELRRKKKQNAARQRLLTLLEERLVQAALDQVYPDGGLDRVVEQIADRNKDPFSVADDIVRNTRFIPPNER